MIRRVLASISYRSKALFRAPLGIVLTWVEQNMAGSLEEKLPHRPIFIIGAPRSGSTLLYQLMTEVLDLGYLSNRHCRYFQGPAVIERFGRPLTRRRSSDFSSQNGETREYWEPSECGEFWYRFFRRRPQYVPKEEVDAKKMRHLRKAIAALVRVFDKPLLFKNLPCALRLQAIADVLPEALFIVIRRELITNARSILAGRLAVLGRYDQWWSLEPPEIEKLRDMPAHIQVVEQIRRIYALIERDRTLIGPERFWDVRYEQLCVNTHDVLCAIEKFLEGRGSTLVRRSEAPKHFVRSPGPDIDTELAWRLQQYISV